uniref:Small EDRK-rich factor-like N-terminal domain-containing protein n=1 Tax=Pseudonaja textilis TaxID=8673 RepID=A0A670XVQ1_PSETE
MDKLITNFRVLMTRNTNLSISYHSLRTEETLSASQRKQRDSEIMQQKQKAADEKKTLQAGAK